ncbi:DUF3150 domain-containing protein [Chitinophaga sp. sic0106]|uniref:DUF3150 domain-containing protein n=1 Tax=Chitinophaga sp. sic0106 TaxID=2854785 RepID=UPI001C48849F|nr:DUF3150 domain-containing protein [Chitinophaga sp. sic0106]MBV7531003.1 hypothetical protein [Chitinophaga sp. sic0106]
MKNLSEKALLVNLHISQWSARKLDKNVIRQLEKQNHTRNIGRFNKLLIDEEKLKPIQKIASACRIFVMDNTLPWGDNGDRLLPATNYFEFLSEISKYKNDFQAAAVQFSREYPTLIQDSKQRLGAMFSVTDYPAIDSMEQRFQLRVGFMPMSNTEDFRLQIDDEEVKELKKIMEEEINSRISTATRDIWYRIKDQVGHMAERLSDPNAIFKNSLVENIRDLVKVLPRLNFTNDPEVEKIVLEMHNLLIDPELLRVNPAVRSEKADRAREIFDSVSSLIA